MPSELETDQDGANFASVRTADGRMVASAIPRNGLDKGAPAPLFELPDLRGGSVSIEQYRGQRVLLVFSDPRCGPCALLTPRLAELAGHAPDVKILIVTRGDAGENRAKFADLDPTIPVAVQKRWEVSRRYAMFATPAAYFVDQDGVIGADVALGSQRILMLLVGVQIRALLTMADELVGPSVGA